MFGLSFEIQCAKNEKRTITFGGDYRIGRDQQIIANLKSRAGKPLGIELVLTRDVFGGDGQAFVRLEKSLKESRLEAGLKFKW